VSQRERAQSQPARTEVTLGWLLDACHELAPDQVTTLLATVAERLGARDARLYLAEVDQRRLVPLPVGDEILEPLDIDGTLAGRAYQTSETTGTDHSEHVWFPVRDGADRLGVLRLAFDESGSIDESALRHLASLAADIVLAKGQYSDLFIRTRRRRPVGLAAEMQWQLLPPLTFSTPHVGVAGILEPAYEVAGDSFDYSLNGKVLTAAIFDGVGHDLGSAVTTTLAVAAYRNARRRGLGLTDTATEIDTALQTQFGDQTFVTAALTELDVSSGMVRWLNAGHPRPLLLRAGHVVRTLACPPRPPLGMPGHAPEIGIEQLEPGDSLLLFTDGIVEARSARRQEFGFTRLAEFFQRAAAAQMAPAETMRRLVNDVIAHNNGNLQDDATCVLIEWRSRRRPAPHQPG
jgi:serine phosphatase RsbU (regulator of sigma subunit)